MSVSLPSDPPAARRLTGVVPELIAALSGTSDWFAPARSAIVCVVDGLGAHNLRARAGHARYLTAAMSKRDVARTVFPSTTAAALSSLLTGTEPGVHGIVGYRALVPDTGEVLNQLRGWDTHGLPVSWQRSTPLFAREADSGRPTFFVSKPEYTGTGFTEATLRGATAVPAEDFPDRVDIAVDLVARHPGALVYLYTPELDGIGHRRGWESDEWTVGLEEVDAALAHLGGSLPKDAGAIVTADHGMIDVPRHRHRLLVEGSPLLEGVSQIGGEPRMLHLYVDPGMVDDAAEAWRAAESGHAWILTRDEAVDAGLFGDVDTAVRPRIGDVLVAARGSSAYYDDRDAERTGQQMIGQHGSLTEAERIVPLIRLGAFA
ncbi:alkaline phosphatase family protein [Microbacterium invictum]|uniref:Alkaline phosphatase family protein n=1 Tax=Microbacterium invictum TaxID=515415 RepID=A0ABZ0V7G0_9MICO|nr:alkaline phosphatase family protein [Microbacterium invictum]WQB69049.1 alkaline phosphatase family protein [Microbacterium invictum]